VFYLMQTHLSSYGTWYLILLGALAIVIMLFAPRGIWGFVSERTGLVFFPVRRRLTSRTESLRDQPVQSPGKPTISVQNSSDTTPR